MSKLFAALLIMLKHPT